MKMMRVVVLVLVGLTFVIVACGDDDEYRLPAGENTIFLGEQPFNDRGTKDLRGKKAFTMEADSFHFAPTFLRGNPGQSLTLDIKNQDQQNRHNFTLPQQQITRDIPPGGAERVRVTFPQSGVLLFFCTFHIENGMRGELLAGDAQPQPAP